MKIEHVDEFREQVAVATSVALDGGTVADIFTISGGPVLVLALIGECTEAVSANACNAKLVADPTTGADTDMCAVLDIQSLGLGSFLTIDGTIANAMVKAVPGTALPLGIGMDIPLILPVGTVDLNLANSNPTSGIATFYLRYKPLKAGALVTGS
jgi:hypothetical protein